MCRTRLSSCLLMSAALLGLAGCDGDDNPLLASLLRAVCDTSGDCYPDAIPVELLIVQAAPDRFSEIDHPLADVPPGTVIDELDGLAGCWARVTTETGVYTDTGDTYVQDKIQAMRFSEAPGRLMVYELLSFPAGSREEEVYGSPFLFVFTESYDILDASTISERIIDGRAGQINEDGTIGFSLFTLSALFSEGNAWESAVTLEGDLLRIDVGSSVPTADASDGSGVSLWRRLDCSE